MGKATLKRSYNTLSCVSSSITHRRSKVFHDEKPDQISVCSFIFLSPGMWLDICSRQQQRGGDNDTMSYFSLCIVHTKLFLLFFYKYISFSDFTSMFVFNALKVGRERHTTTFDKDTHIHRKRDLDIPLITEEITGKTDQEYSKLSATDFFGQKKEKSFD